MAAWMLLCALLLRSMLPLGYMPDLSARGDGGLPLVICTGSALDSVVVLDSAGKPVKTTDLPAPSDTPCTCPKAQRRCGKAPRPLTPPPPALTVCAMINHHTALASRRRRAFARGFVLAGLGR